MARKTYSGPMGVKLHIDESRAHKDDPGADTPALVEYRGFWGTYWCAAETGDVDGRALPKIVVAWLNSPQISDIVGSIVWS